MLHEDWTVSATQKGRRFHRMYPVGLPQMEGMDDQVAFKPMHEEQVTFILNVPPAGNP